MNKVKIKVYEKNNRFINYLINNCICYDSLVFLNDSFILNVDYSDYKRLSRRYRVDIIKYYGKVGFIYFIRFHKYMIISFIISLIFLYLLSCTIFDIKVNTNNKNIEKLIISELKDNGIYRNKKKKNYEELSVIKKRILESNKNSLEWLEIKSKGCVYIVEVTPRIKNKKEEDNTSSSSIYASHNGVVKHINVISGTRIVDVNDYVHKGDLLISGNILKNDEVVGSINAKGNVYAEVWYIVNTSVPLEYYEYSRTGKIINHYYLDILGKKFTLIGKYDSDNTVNKTYTIIDKPYLIFKLYKERKIEYKNSKISLSKKEAYNKAIKYSEERIESTLKDDEYIISKKVLKKEAKYSKINIEVFFKIYKNIGYTSNIDSLGETNGKSNERGNW